MRVLFDGYWWNEGPFSNRMVQREIIAAWSHEYPQDELMVVVPATSEPAGAPDGVRIISSRLGRLQALMNILLLPLIARRQRADVIIAHNFAPLTRRSSTFIHDLMFMDHPEWFTATENAYFRLMTYSARRRGTRVVTSSRTEARRISRLTGHDAEAVGLAVSPTLLTACPSRPRIPDHLRGFGLAVGRLNVRKNLGAVIAGAMRSGAFSVEHPLLVVGAESGRETTWPEGTSVAIEERSVIMLGSVSDGELRWLYENAAVFIMMSRDEGYGLPVAEAIAFGTPTVASDIDVFRELFGNRVLLANPDDTEEIAARIRTATATPRPEAVLTEHWSRIAQRLRDHAKESARA